MPLLEKGVPVEDRFVQVADDAPLPADSPAVISFARLQRDADALAGRNVPLGVQMASATQARDIAPFLDRVALVVIEFPKFRDGRGFTIARTLRERFGYAGELRVRCGFTSVAVPEGADLGVWAAALDRFHVAYQAGMDAAPVISGLRRRLALG